MVLVSTVSHFSRQLLHNAFLAPSKIECLPRQRHMTRAMDQFSVECAAERWSEKISDMGNESTIMIRKPSLSESENLVRAAKLELLMFAVLNDTRTAGLSVVHAEPGTGKSVATVGAIQLADALKLPGVRVFLHGDFHQNLQDFFDAPDSLSAVFVAEHMFALLQAKGIRVFSIVFDHTFNRGMATDEETFLGIGLQKSLAPMERAEVVRSPMTLGIPVHIST